jgi:hypothetical protein
MASPTASGKYAGKVNLEDAAAQEFFLANVNARTLPQDLWPYSKGRPKDWQRIIVWQECRTSRGPLGDLFGLTNGRQLKHKAFFHQLQAFLQAQKQKAFWDENETEKACYRIRAMMAHMRDFKRLQFKEPTRAPPIGCEAMGVILSAIQFDQDEPMKDSFEDSQDGDQAEALSAEQEDIEEDIGEEVVLVITPKKAIQVDLTGDSPKPYTKVDLDDLDKNLFGKVQTPSKKSKTVHWSSQLESSEAAPENALVPHMSRAPADALKAQNALYWHQNHWQKRPLLLHGCCSTAPLLHRLRGKTTLHAQMLPILGNAALAKWQGQGTGKDKAKAKAKGKGKGKDLPKEKEEEDIMDPVKSLKEKVRVPAPREALKADKKKKAKAKAKGRPRFKKKGKAKAKGKGNGKPKAKGHGKAKAQAQENDQETLENDQDKIRKALALYNPAKHPGVTFQNLQKRAHSKVYHHVYQKFNNKTSMTEDQAKHQARLQAQACQRAFHEAYAYAYGDHVSDVD